MAGLYTHNAPSSSFVTQEINLLPFDTDGNFTYGGDLDEGGNIYEPRIFPFYTELGRVANSPGNSSFSVYRVIYGGINITRSMFNLGMNSTASPFARVPINIQVTVIGVSSTSTDLAFNTFPSFYHNWHGTLMLNSIGSNNTYISSWSSETLTHSSGGWSTNSNNANSSIFFDRLVQITTSNPNEFIFGPTGQYANNYVYSQSNTSNLSLYFRLRFAGSHPQFFTHDDQRLKGFIKIF